MMGNWKSRQIQKKSRASRTRSTPCKIYVVLPPEGGWPGGMPDKNGYPAKTWPHKVSI